jgi:hypothetical protein
VPDTTTLKVPAPRAAGVASARVLEPGQFWGLTFGDHPDMDIYDLTEMLYATEPEYMAALEADILRHGVLEPVQMNGYGAVSNGHHRLAVAFTHDIPVPLSGMHPPTERDAFWSNIHGEMGLRHESAGRGMRAR